jgi:hypothetical protein
VLLFAACSGDSHGTAPVTKPASPAVAALTLTKRPDGVLAVVAAKQKSPNDALAVTGRVASVVPGRAAFMLMDLALPYCGETNKGDTCKTPWDYCCESKETRTANSLLVEARGADGNPLTTPGLGDVRLLDQVTVTGKLVRDEHGNTVLVATGWMREARPELPDNLRWPQ